MKRIFLCLPAAALLVAGCIHSSPRNQTNYVTVREVNVHGPGATNGVPSSITIGTAHNDQMIDQGDESSGGQGNRTPVSLSVPSGAASVLGNVAEGATKGAGTWFGGKKPGASDCADGSCAVADGCADGSCGDGE